MKIVDVYFYVIMIVFMLEVGPSGNNLTTSYMFERCSWPSHFIGYLSLRIAKYYTCLLNKTKNAINENNLKGKNLFFSKVLSGNVITTQQLSQIHI